VGAAVALVVAPSEPPAPAPSLVAATELSLRPATLPAPAPYRSHPAVLRLEVQGLPYPNWERRFGWRAAGARRDRIAGRAATTLFYDKAGRRIAYTIVSRPALALGRAAAVTSRAGVELRTFAVRGRVLVSWRRRGHTCVLSGRHVPLGTLLALGAWRAGGAIPY
jgi:hypothetical protein